MSTNKVRTCLLATVKSDSHTWNLIYIQLLLEELGFNVLNLGPCVSPRDTIQAIKDNKPLFVVISSVNGHGWVEGESLYQLAASELMDSCPEFLIGGKLSVRESDEKEIVERLSEIGYSGVFVGKDSIKRFVQYIESVSSTAYALEAV